MKFTAKMAAVIITVIHRCSSPTKLALVRVREEPCGGEIHLWC